MSHKLKVSKTRKHRGGTVIATIEGSDSDEQMSNKLSNPNITDIVIKGVNQGLAKYFLLQTKLKL